MRDEDGGMHQAVRVACVLERQEEKGAWVDSTQIRSWYFQTADSCW